MRDRLPPQSNEWLDRSREIGFTFEGRTYRGYSGDTISTALWANGVRVLGRSFKYHRPRGIFSLADADCNSLLQMGAVPNVRGDTTHIEPDMCLRAVNTVGGIEKDLARFIDRLDAFLPVGFYYKAFHRPQFLYPLWERLIRRMAGLGVADPLAPGEYTPKGHAFCDVLVIGSGPSGLSAALAAAEAGAAVVLVERDPHLGGSLTLQRNNTDEGHQRLINRVLDHPKIESRTGTTACGLYADRWIALVDDRCLTKCRAGAVVVATGCEEQMAVFDNNDLPGVMLGSAAQRLLHRFAVRPFHRGVVVTANSDGYRVALDLVQTGVEVTAIADLRPEGDSSTAADHASREGIPIYRGHAVVEAVPAKRLFGVQGALLVPLDQAGRPNATGSRRVDCDGIAMSTGWVPRDQLIRQAGGVMAHEPTLQQPVPAELPPGIFAAGRANGYHDLDARIADGGRAGAAAAAIIGFVAPAPRNWHNKSLTRPTSPVSHPYPVYSHDAGTKSFVDLDEDVSLRDIEQAVAEGFDSAELLKRYTTVGMGPSQGKHSNLLALRILERLGKHDLASDSQTTARPFWTPVPLKHLAGRRFSPIRRTPLHDIHKALQAEYLHAGPWLRPEYYAVDGLDADEAVTGEIRNVRERVGVIDLGTLGKIELRGLDAVVFLERIYTNRFANLAVGKLRYGLSCDEQGVVIEDGVVARVAEDVFYLTTTTTGIATFYRELQRWLLIWGLRVELVNLTTAITALNLAGPRARRVLARISDIDCGAKPMPYLGYREGAVAGARARVMRIGFVGEWGYELHVPAAMGVYVWQELLRAGEPDGIRPFGVAALRLLRLEKGHVIVGQDTDAMSHPFELGMGWAVDMDKPFFVGQRTLRVLQRQESSRRLVGFQLAAGYDDHRPGEGDLILNQGELLGRVTSFGYSQAKQRYVGLAFVPPNLGNPGTPFEITVDRATRVPARVVELPFYDRDSERQKHCVELSPEQVEDANTAAPRRSAIDSLHRRYATNFIEFHRMELPADFGDAAGERRAVKRLALADKSAFPKFGIRLIADGDAPTNASTLELPSEIFGVVRTASQYLVMRSGLHEYLVEAAGAQPVEFLQLHREIEQNRDGFHLFSLDESGFVITGSEARALLLQVCAHPFSEPEPKLVMTQVAGVQARILYEHVDDVAVFYLWCDDGYAHYLWQQLQSIVEEMSGRVVGLTAVLPLCCERHSSR